MTGIDVYFHVGPHRSGTTSIQFFLRKSFSSLEPQPVWYPGGEYLGAGGGHAPLAAPFIPPGHGTNTRYAPAEGLARLNDIRASCASVRSLLISSEDFAFAADADLARIREVFRGDRFHLIFTVSPLAKRYVSLWQSLVQFGHTLGMEQSFDEVMRSPGFHPLFVRRQLKALAPDSADLLVTNPSAEADQLLKDFCAICRIDWPENIADVLVAKKNVSLGAYEVEALRLVNTVHADFLLARPERRNWDT